MTKNNKYQIEWVGNVVVFLSQHNPFQPAIEYKKEQIEEIWKTENTQRPPERKLKNGSPLFFVGHRVFDDTLCVSVCVGQYKHWFAQYCDPSLAFGIKPVGVYGITILQETQEVLFGRRSRFMTQHKGFYGLVPSGGLDASTIRNDGTVDYQKKLKEEFVEETKLLQKHILEINTLALILDTNDNVFSLGCVMNISSKHTQVVEGFALSTEYDPPPYFVHKNKLISFISEHEHELTPPSVAFSNIFLSQE